MKISAFVWLALVMIAPRLAAQDTRVALRMFDGLPLALVSIDDAPPRWFFVDTGASVTTLSDQLARELGLTAAAPFEVETVTGTVPAFAGRIRSLRVGSADLGGGAVVWHALDRVGAPKQVDGILGFDRLSRVNFILDYGRRTLELDPSARRVAALRGEHVPFSRSLGRPVVDAVVQVSNDPEAKRRLVVDSGAETAVLIDRVRAGVARLMTVAGSAIGERKNVFVTLGGLPLGASSAVVVPRPDAATRDDEGLLPGSLFAWMYFDVVRGEMVWKRAG